MVLPAEAARAWEAIAPVVGHGVYLGGGTALAVHLHHRVSRDLGFFFHERIDLETLTRSLRSIGPFAITLREEGTLNGVFSDTRVRFLSAIGQRRLVPTTTVAGIEVAGLADILAMKVKIIGDRGEMRDYFDLMAIERDTGRTIEEGLALYMARYDVQPEHVTLRHIVDGLGYLDDVQDDDSLPVGRDEIVSYWRSRQAELIRDLGRFPPRPAPASRTPPPGGGSVWVEGYERSDGRRVRGHWRVR